MRWTKALLAVLLCGLFALLLSALVVSPEEAVAAPEPISWVDARFQPLSLPVQGPDATSVQPQLSFRAMALLLWFAVPVLPALAARRDANGRVLQAKRYENSFYQVFRQEVAGG